MARSMADRASPSQMVSRMAARQALSSLAAMRAMPRRTRKLAFSCSCFRKGCQARMGSRAAMASKQVMPPGLDSIRLARAMYLSTWAVKGTASMFSYLPLRR